MQLYEFISTDRIYFVVASSKAEAVTVLKRDVDALVNDPKWDYSHSELEDEDKYIGYANATRIDNNETLDVMQLLPKNKLAHVSVGDIVLTVQRPCLFSFGNNSSYSTNLSPMAKKYASNLASLATRDEEEPLEMPIKIVTSYTHGDRDGDFSEFQLTSNGITCHIHKEPAEHWKSQTPLDFEWEISVSDLVKAVDAGNSSTGDEGAELIFKNSGTFSLNDIGSNPKTWQFVITPPRRVASENTSRAYHIYAVLPFAVARGFVQQLGT